MIGDSASLNGANVERSDGQMFAPCSHHDSYKMATVKQAAIAKALEPKAEEVYWRKWNKHPVFRCMRCPALEAEKDEKDVIWRHLKAT